MTCRGRRILRPRRHSTGKLKLLKPRTIITRRLQPQRLKMQRHIVRRQLLALRPRQTTSQLRTTQI
ncbi:MAG: hypothetical protein ACK559_18870, partial [bacterium]